VSNLVKAVLLPQTSIAINDVKTLRHPRTLTIPSHWLTYWLTKGTSRTSVF
jgi:hypothetical protein